MSFDMKKMVAVTNRSAGRVVYNIPEHSIRRVLSRGETREVPYEELVWLSYTPGGKRLMQDDLYIRELQVTKELDIQTEQEYFLDEAGVKKLLMEGSLDALLDALDFAPSGVIELIKDCAVTMPLYDMQKREAILKATGFNVTAAIDNSKPDEDEVPVEAPTANRRARTDAGAPEAPQRRVQSRYEVVSSATEQK
jgi:hypothetical protein